MQCWALLPMSGMFSRSHVGVTTVRDQIQVSFHVPATSEWRARIEQWRGIRVVTHAEAGKEEE